MAAVTGAAGSSPEGSGTSDQSFSSEHAYARLVKASAVMLVIATAGIVLTIVPSQATRSLGVLIVTLVTGGIGGAVIGFLFGIPRVLTGDPAPPAPAPAPAPAAGNGTAATTTPTPAGRRLLASNSNLEQVSDWLTKIILGVGLTQFYEINDGLFRFEGLVAHYVGPQDHLTPMIAAIVMVFAMIAGFLMMYLETRLVISRIFNSVEGELQQAIQDRDKALTRAAGLETVVKDIAAAPATSATTLAPAAESLKAAANSTQASPELKSIAAQALAALGRTHEANDLIPTGDRASVRDRIAAMQVALYKPSPDGYQEALSIAGSLTGATEAQADADYWFYQAAAFGQKHHDLLSMPEGEARTADLASTKDNALDCIRRCLRTDPGYEIRIYWLMNPTLSPTPRDDDLADFANDPDFQALVKPPLARGA